MTIDIDKNESNLQWNWIEADGDLSFVRCQLWLEHPLPVHCGASQRCGAPDTFLVLRWIGLGLRLQQ